MLSGRYRTDKLLSHFDKHEDHRCRLCFSESGDIEHLLVHCSSLSGVRVNQLQSLNNRRDFSQISVDLILDYWKRPVSHFMQLLLDCSVLPEVITATQNNQNQDVMQDLFKFSRTWCLNVHMSRMKLLGHWKKYF